VNIGGKWFSYEWMQPIGSIAAIVSDYMEGREEGRGIENSITEALRAGGSILFEQSFMRSFQTFFTADNPLDGFMEAMFDEPSVFVPQIISQLASATDDTRRTTFDNSSKLKTALNSVLYKIPGLRQTLTEDVDVFGRTVPNSQGNFWDAFMNPANTYTDTSDEVTNHVYALYKNLGDAKMIPSKAPYSIEVGGKKYPLTAEERAEYQMVMGTVAHKLIEYLIANDLYNSYTDEEKANVIKAVYSYADKVAKSQYKVDYTFEMAHDDDPYITRAKFDAMTDEEKQALYSKNTLSSYAEILNTTEEGAVLYFANAGARAAVIHATTEYNGAQAAEIIARAKANAKEYGGEEEEKATMSSFKSSTTTYWKPFYKVAYYEGDRDTMNKIKETLLDTGLYSNYELNKKLNDWLEE
jgi:osmotically-inducible protein OsmY